jgi:hypothetical protein
MTASIPLPEGLHGFLAAQSPDMWHEFALGLDFADPKATIDLLLAAATITTSPACDRATAAVILAKAAAAGFHRGECPPGFDEEAARAFAVRLSDALANGAYQSARFALPPEALRLVTKQLGPRGPLPLPALALGHTPHRPRFAFAGWHPVRHALRAVAA